MKLLVDNCLSEELAHLARERGHLEATHIRWLGKGDWKDWNLKDLIDSGGYTFVTKNSVDFRGPRTDRGSGGQHATLELHGGLVCLNGPVGMDLDLQIELFEAVLDELAADADLINAALEVSLERWEDDELLVERYPIPMDGPYARDVGHTSHVRSRSSA
ncbi:DUF5615 family PIN-like protein [Roseomonas genomospecies 6]|uniref:DUF5615 domain-containing protein n=1 Tax=Roseomonas genomospecies 6 TaxID=214106 RepID=A0A9W7NFT8_9PROT|nr:DUF5615 family PIN-like protein [Roseomonas genomospecies 6]KAA0675829.1 hypothetical protein DS843_29820 [Roseomonas genomospecies 6]